MVGAGRECFEPPSSACAGRGAIIPPQHLRRALVENMTTLAGAVTAWILPSLFFRTSFAFALNLGFLESIQMDLTLGHVLDFHPNDPSISDSTFFL